MDRNTVISVLDSLANGCDPATGAPLGDALLQNADTKLALSTASTLLKEQPPVPKPRKDGAQLTAAGTNWTEQEESLLCHEFDSGMTIAKIAVQHGRTSGAITARLVKIGRLDPAAVKPRERGLAVTAPS